MLGKKVLGQLHDVVRTLAQRRQTQLHDGQAIVEIGAKGPTTHFAGEIAIRRGDDTHVH